MYHLAKLEALMRPFFYLHSKNTPKLTDVPADVFTDHIFPRLSLTDLILIANVHPRLHKLAAKAMNRGNHVYAQFNSLTQRNLTITRVPITPKIDFNYGKSVAIFSSLHNAVEVWCLLETRLVAYYHLPPNHPFPESIDFSRTGQVVFVTYKNGVSIYSIPSLALRGQLSELVPMSSVAFSFLNDQLWRKSVSVSPLTEGRIVATMSRDGALLAAVHAVDSGDKTVSRIFMKCVLLHADSNRTYTDDISGWPYSSNQTKGSFDSWRMTQKVSKREGTPQSIHGVDFEKEKRELLSTIIVETPGSKVNLSSIEVNASPFRVLVPPGAMGDVGFLLDPSDASGESRLAIPCTSNEDEKVYKVCFSSCGQYLFVVRTGIAESELVKGDIVISISKVQLNSSEVVYRQNIAVDRQHSILGVLFSGDSRLAVVVMGQEYETSCIIQGWLVLDVVASGRILVKKHVEIADEYDQTFSISEDGQELCFARHRAIGDQIYTIEVYATANGRMLSRVDNDVQKDAGFGLENSLTPGKHGCDHAFLRKVRGVVSMTKLEDTYVFSTSS